MKSRIKLYLMITSALLLIIICLIIQICPHSLYISTASPIVGQPITVSSHGRLFDRLYKYQWYIDDDIILNESGQSYIPSENDYEHWISCKAFIRDKEYAEISIYFSKLPVVYIDIDEGKTVNSKSDYFSGNIVIQGNELFDKQYEGRVQIRGRGNSTWIYEKKPYKLKFDKKTDLFGFGESKHYVLLANAIDESLMRNTVATDISRRLGLVAMDTTWVDLIINGEYEGNYQLCESVRIGENAIDIIDWENHEKTVSDDICSMDGGVLFELSEEMDEQSQFVTKGDLKVMIKEPEISKSNTQLIESIKVFWEDTEEAYSANNGYNAKGKHYTEYMDLDSMVSYYLTMELMGNTDAIWKSRFAYKNINEKIVWGPVWDFDRSSGSYKDAFPVTGWCLSSANPYCHWVDKPEFCSLLFKKYWGIRKYLEEIIQDGGTIDRYFEYLLASGESNDQRWEAIAKRGFSGDNGDVAALKKYLKQRFIWMDEQFSSIEHLMQSLSYEDDKV